MVPDTRARPILYISVAARAHRRAGRWQGNVRGVENAVACAVRVSVGTEIAVHDLPLEAGGGPALTLLPPGARSAEIGRWAILATLEATRLASPPQELRNSRADVSATAGA